MSDNQNSISLNKYISSTGLCSRREADKLIEEGKVTINDQVARKGNRVEEGDEVKVNNEVIVPKTKKVYIALHKPVGITCTTDTRVEGNIIDFINYPERIFNIGRLDKDSEGLILMTNDGEIVNKILRSSNKHEKEYIVTVNKELSRDFIKKMGNGVPILDTYTKKCKVTKIDKYTFKITLTQGLNRQIRRMCEFFDYRVIGLKRIRIMHIKLKGLAYGNWRYLSDKELAKLEKLTESSDKNSIY